MRVPVTARLLASFQALAGAGLPRKDFTWNSGDWVNSNLPGNRYSSGRSYFSFEPQTNLNYAALIGDIWTNSAVQACMNWIWRAWPESYPCLKEEVTVGTKVQTEEIADAPLLELLKWPNAAQDDTVLWSGTTLSFWCDGNAYWGVNRKRGGDAAELVYIPHNLIQPKRDPGSTNPGPDYFEYTPKGDPIRLNPADVIHFRFGIDPYNTLRGLSGWASVRRHVYTDNEAINYVATTVRRRGAPWVIWTAEENAPPIPDLDAVERSIDAKTTSDNRGGVMVMDFGLKATFPPTLKDQSADTLHRIPETRICALGGLSPIAVGLASGLERSTFENTKQGELSSWYTIMAVQRMMGRQGTQQLIRRPQIDPRISYFAAWEAKNASRKIWMGFDYSEVRALQPDKTDEWKRVGQAYKDGLLTQDEGRAEIGYEAMTDEQRAQLAPKPAPAQPGQPIQPGQQMPSAAGTNGNGASSNGTGKTKDYDLTDLLPPAPAHNWVEDVAARIEAELEALHGESA